ncbi:unnamed protein product, partial [Rotaria socialis]
MDQIEDLQISPKVVSTDIQDQAQLDLSMSKLNISNIVDKGIQPLEPVHITDNITNLIEPTSSPKAYTTLVNAVQSTEITPASIELSAVSVPKVTSIIGKMLKNPKITETRKSSRRTNPPVKYTPVLTNIKVYKPKSKQIKSQLSKVNELMEMKRALGNTSRMQDVSYTRTSVHNIISNEGMNDQLLPHTSIDPLLQSHVIHHVITPPSSAKGSPTLQIQPIFGAQAHSSPIKSLAINQITPPQPIQRRTLLKTPLLQTPQLISTCQQQMVPTNQYTPTCYSQFNLNYKQPRYNQPIYTQTFNTPHIIPSFNPNIPPPTSTPLTSQYGYQTAPHLQYPTPSYPNYQAPPQNNYIAPRLYFDTPTSTTQGPRLTSHLPPYNPNNYNAVPNHYSTGPGLHTYIPPFNHQRVHRPISQPALVRPYAARHNAPRPVLIQSNIATRPQWPHNSPIPSIHSQHSPVPCIHSQHSPVPSIHSQHSPTHSLHSQQSGNSSHDMSNHTNYSNQNLSHQSLPHANNSYERELPTDLNEDLDDMGLSEVQKEMNKLKRLCEFNEQQKDEVIRQLKLAQEAQECYRMRVDERDKKVNDLEQRHKRMATELTSANIKIASQAINNHAPKLQAYTINQIISKFCPAEVNICNRIMRNNNVKDWKMLGQVDQKQLIRLTQEEYNTSKTKSPQDLNNNKFKPLSKHNPLYNKDKILVERLIKSPKESSRHSTPKKSSINNCSSDSYENDFILDDPKDQRIRKNRTNKQCKKPEKIVWPLPNGTNSSVHNINVGTNNNHSLINYSVSSNQNREDQLNKVRNEVAYWLHILRKENEFIKFVEILKVELDVYDTNNQRIILHKIDSDSFPKWSGDTMEHFLKYLRNFHVFALGSMRIENHKWISELLKRVNTGFLKQFLTEIETDEMTYMTFVVYLMTLIDDSTINKTHNIKDQFYKATLGQKETSHAFGLRLKLIFIKCFPEVDFEYCYELKSKYFSSIPVEVKNKLKYLIEKNETADRRTRTYSDIVNLSTQAERKVHNNTETIKYFQNKSKTATKLNESPIALVPSPTKRPCSPFKKSVTKNIILKKEDIDGNKEFQCPVCKRKLGSTPLCKFCDKLCYICSSSQHKYLQCSSNINAVSNKPTHPTKPNKNFKGGKGHFKLKNNKKFEKNGNRNREVSIPEPKFPNNNPKNNFYYGGGINMTKSGVEGINNVNNKQITTIPVNNILNNIQIEAIGPSQDVIVKIQDQVQINNSQD